MSGGWQRGGTALLVAAFLSGCVTPGAEPQARQPAVGIEGVTIRNELAYPITDVMIEVPATGAFAGCGTVLPRSECSNTFQQVAYRANAAVVTWKEHGTPQGTGEFVIEAPDDLEAGRPARVEVVIFSPGEAGARLIQH